jgi:hypothetical protein
MTATRSLEMTLQSGMGDKDREVFDNLSFVQV